MSIEPTIKNPARRLEKLDVEFDHEPPFWVLHLGFKDVMVLQWFEKGSNDEGLKIITLRVHVLL